MVAWAFEVYPVQNTTANIENVMEGVNCVTQNVKAVAKEMKERAGHAIGEAVPMDKLRDLMTAQSMPFENVKKTLKKVDEALGKMMKWQKSLIDKINAETRQLKTLNISITRDQNMSDHFAFDRKKMHKALHDEISTYENIISAIVFLLDSVSIAMIFFTPFMATLYVRRFNTGEAIDNYYVTPNFIEIDRARALNGLPTLLPFQPIERKS
uniref:Uncharacterized protein n=1 Tax=Meloidogyne javanica TaxID=6303 RepID=A0A915MV93_MELJA